MEYAKALLYTELLDTICENKYRPVRVIYDLVSVKKHELLDKFYEDYSIIEVEELYQFIKSCPFNELIIEFHNPVTDEEWD